MLQPDPNPGVKRAASGKASPSLRSNASRGQQKAGTRRISGRDLRITGSGGTIEDIFDGESTCYVGCGYDDDEEVDVEVPAEHCRILMPLDSSANGLYAIYYYLKKVHRPENEVYCCYVSDKFLAADVVPSTPNKKKCCSFMSNKMVDVGPSPGVLAELRKRDHGQCMKVKHRLKHLFNLNGVRWTFKRLRSTDIPDAIMKYRKEIGAELIVMGSRGLKGMKATLFGAVSSKTLELSPVPILVIKRPVGVLSTECVNKESHIH